MTTLKVLDRTGDGLRKMLFEELEMLRAGRISSAQAQATARLATVLINSVETEIRYFQMIRRGKTPVLGTIRLVGEA